MTEPVASESYTGQVVYMYAYDLAYDMEQDTITQLLGQPIEQFVPVVARHSPRQLFFYRPQMARLEPVAWPGPHGPVRIERAIKIFPVGAISISVRVPFTDLSLAQLVEYHNLRAGPLSLDDEVARLADRVAEELGPYCIRPIRPLRDLEMYTVFCIDSRPPGIRGGGIGSEDWLLNHRRQVAALLTQEPAATNLSSQESDESTGQNLSYYEHDLAVIDWDSALVLDEPGKFEETLHIIELANVQLVELEAYDRMLDEALDSSYRDLMRQGYRIRGERLDELRQLRIDMARLSDELENITKFFGDWHLARTFQHLSSRFHLADWHRVIDEKLKTLDDLYQILKQDRLNRWMFGLEIAIVLLFIIDLVILLLPLLK